MTGRLAALRPTPERLASLGLTPGQVWTLGLGLLLGVVLLATSVPGALESRSAAEGAGAPPPAAPGAAAVPPAAEGAAEPAPPAPAAALLPPAPPVTSVTGLALPPPLTGGLAALPLPPPAAPPAAAPPPPAPDAPAPGAAGPGEPLPPPPADSAPLLVVEGGYSSPDPAPAASSGVPEDGLPVGARAGRPQETSYVRLSGTGTELTLPISDEGAVRPAEAVLRACPITTPDWTPGRPGPAVPFDDTRCVTGLVEAGALRFDLTGFPDRTGREGFALQADLAADAPTTLRTFRIVLDPTP